MTNIEKDTEARNKIVADTDSNFFVEAGAGSGKTTMLVSRMVAMVEQGKDISKICAITFTKAAANEFYERFQKKLIERSNPDIEWKDTGHAGQLPRPTEESRARCEAALRNIDLCFMGTIDSFCNMILSEHPSDAGIPSDATIINSEDAKEIYKQIYVQICEGQYREDADGEDLELLSRRYRKMHWNAEEVFVKGIPLLMGNRNVHFHYTPVAEMDLDVCFSTEKAQLLNTLQVLYTNAEEVIWQKNGELVEEVDAFKERIQKIASRIGKSWNNDIKGVIVALNDFAKIQLMPEALNRYHVSLDPFFRLHNGKKDTYGKAKIGEEGEFFQKIKEYQYSVTMHFLTKCVKIIEKVMLEKGRLTFYDYLYYLRNMLKKDAAEGGKLIEHIYNRHSYFLIDEFQDTNPMQAEIFFYLASEHPEVQWYSCKPRKGSLFIVGDPKQSIYRFRGADVASFLNVKSLFADEVGEVLYLSRNFRSQKCLVEYFDRVFTKTLDGKGTQCKFEAIPVPEEDSEQFSGIYSFETVSEKMIENDNSLRNKTNVYQIPEIIQKLYQQPNLKVKDPKTGVIRPIELKDFMVITFSKKKLAPIMERLSELHIPMKVEGMVRFESCEALKAITEIYAAVVDSNDEIALYGALTGKLLNLCAEQILLFRAAEGKISLREGGKPEDLSDKNVAEVWRKVEKLRGLYQKALRLSPAALFSEIMDSFRVFKTVEAEDLEVLYYTLELMRNAEKNGVVSCKDGAAYLWQLVSGKADEERCLKLDENRDCVHMANLHKVKGLEAPIVILAGTSSNTGGDPNYRIEHGEAGAEGYVFKVQESQEGSNNKYALYETSQFGNQEKSEKKSSNEEKERLVYVAATRARNVLIIGNNRNSAREDNLWAKIAEKDKTEDFETAFKDLEKVEMTIGNGKEISAAELYEEAAETCVLNHREVLNGTYITENPSHAKLPSKLEEEGAAVIVTITDKVAEASKKTDGEDSVNSEADAEERENAEVKEKISAEKEKKEISVVHRFPALLGTMTHRLMEVIVSSKNQVDIKKMVTEIINEYSTPNSKPYEEKLTQALLKVAVTMQGGGYSQLNDAPKDLLQTLLSAEKCYCEVPFCYKVKRGQEMVLCNGIMDVVYMKDGMWHIIDYKTNIDGNELDAKYRAQLEAYKEALSITMGVSAEDAMTYHIDI